jgi:hypothetical protein
MKLSKAIIKKYGISKKAWAVARGKKTTHSTKVRTMAKRRKTYAKVSHRKSHRKGGFSKGGFGGLGKMLGAGVYGATREYISNALNPVTEKIPLGNIADEVVMIGALTLGKKFLGKKVPMANDYANAGILIESARIGATLAAGQFSLGGNASSSGGMRVVG